MDLIFIGINIIMVLFSGIQVNMDTKIYIAQLLSTTNWQLTTIEHAELHYLDAMLGTVGLNAMTVDDKQKLSLLSAKLFRENLHKHPEICEDQDWDDSWSAQTIKLSCDMCFKTSQINKSPYVRVTAKGSEHHVYLTELEKVYDTIPVDVTQFLKKNQKHIIDYWFAMCDSRQFRERIFNE